MQQRTGFPLRGSRRGVWLAIGLAVWAATVFGLAGRLSPRPLHRVPCAKNLVPQEFADDRTLLLLGRYVSRRDSVFRCGPLTFVDLPSGSVRTIDLPDDSLGAQAAADSPETDDELLAAAEKGWLLETCRLSGPYAVAEMIHGGRDRRVHVWNWKTGQELLRRDATGFKTGILGDRLWLQSADRRATGATLEIVEIPTGTAVPTAIPVDEFDWGELSRDREPRFGTRGMRLVASPDGRWLASIDDSGIRLRNVDRSETLRVSEIGSEPGTEIGAFSADSKRFATLSGWSLGAEPHRRLWQIYDLEHGTPVARHEESREGYWHRLPHSEVIRFLEPDEVVAAYGDSPNNRRSSIGSVSLWDCRADQIHSIPGHLSEPTDDRGPLGACPTPRIVRDGLALFDVATGERTGTVPPEPSLYAVSSDARWAIAEAENEPLWNRVTSLLARFFPTAGATLQNAAETRMELHDLQRGTLAARFGSEWYSFAFTPDGTWLVGFGEDDLGAWPLPLSRWPVLLRAFVWSLPVPLLVAAWTGFRVWRKRRPLS